MAALERELGAGHAALETLRRVHSAQPENPRVLRALREAYSQVGDIDALESLYSVRNAWDDLCDVLSGLDETTTGLDLLEADTSSSRWPPAARMCQRELMPSSPPVVC